MSARKTMVALAASFVLGLGSVPMFGIAEGVTYANAVPSVSEQPPLHTVGSSSGKADKSASDGSASESTPSATEPSTSLSSPSSEPASSGLASSPEEPLSAPPGQTAPTVDVSSQQGQTTAESGATPEALVVPEEPESTSALEAMAEEGTSDMYRMYNPWSGEHLYTSDAYERDSLGALGWRYEGVGWVAPAHSTAPVYRLYNPYTGDHHYTMSSTEYRDLGAIGWSQEGVGWYSDTQNRVPLYREFNPYAQVGTHNYTTGRDEHDTLVSLGWTGEGVAWYGVEAGYGLPYPSVSSSFAAGGSFLSVWLDGGADGYGGIEYSVMDAGGGWQSWAADGETASASTPIGAICVRLNGLYGIAYDVWYRAYVEQVGWSGWATNGQGAGSSGLSLGLDAIEIVLVPRGNAAPGATDNVMLDGNAVGKLGYQNPAGFYQVSCKNVQITSEAVPPWDYVTPSRISVWATREDCVNAFLQRAHEYAGTPYVWDYACAPGVGVDCIGLVYQCAYACGMDMGGGTGYDDFNPWAHYITGYNGWHSHDANNFWDYGRAMHVPLEDRRPGDLISWWGHIAIYLGEDTVIEALSTAGGVVYSNMWSFGVPRGCIRLFQ